MPNANERKIKGSQYYVDHIEENLDLWTSLDMHEVEVEEVTQTSAYEADLGDGEKVKVEVPQPKSFSERARFLFKGAELPLKVTMIHREILHENKDDSVSREEYLESRRWLLANAPQAGSPAVDKSPTPKEQALQAAALVEKAGRSISPELQKQIDALPKASELLIKFPRELTREEKKKIESVAKSLITKGSVKLTVTL